MLDVAAIGQALINEYTEQTKANQYRIEGVTAFFERIKQASAALPANPESGVSSPASPNAESPAAEAIGG